MALYLIAAAVAGAENTNQIKGFVYLDKNGDGQRDPAEQGVPGVGVSNGVDVVLTDSSGAYDLAAGRGQLVFVIKPAGYRLPETSDHRVKFSFQASATAQVRDFPLLAGAPGERFSVLVFADPQINSKATADFLDRGIVQHLVGAGGYRFGMTLGDIVWDDLSLFPTEFGIIGRIGIPWFNVIGNHDVNMEARSPAQADQEFRRWFGPSHYAFNEGRVHFIVLDSTLLGPGTPKLHYGVGLTEDQLQFMANDLAQVSPDHLVVVATHQPVFQWSSNDRARLFKLMARYDHTLSLSGHTHFQSRWRYGPDEGWPGRGTHEHYNVGTASGDWWSGNRDANVIADAMMRDGTPKGYASLRFDGADYRIEYTCADGADGRQFHTDGPAEVGASKAPAFVYLNYYLGSAATHVEYRQGESEWKSFERALEPDPVRVRKYESWTAGPQPAAGSRPSMPVNSTHLWKAPLPTDGPPGKRTLQIRIRTEEGEELPASFSYELKR